MIWPLLYAIPCLALAWNNANRIKSGKKINHPMNGAIHIVAALCIGIFTKWQYGVATLFVARLVFDTGLNIMRGLPFDYTPLKPASVIDRVEKSVFRGRIWLAKIVYLVWVILLLCL